jgi:hypothetical protein
MNLCRILVSIAVLAVLGLSPASAQRVAFERKKFDRSRFDRPGQPASAPESPASAPATLADPSASFASPMPTEPPAPSTSTWGNEFASPAPAAGPDDSTNTAIFSADSTLPSHPPGGSPYPATATPEEKALIDTPLFDQIPSKWFNNAKDHDELVELQKKTGTCLLVYFKNFAVPNEKGLCNWFEKTVTTDIKWRKAMKYYLKLEINIPGNSVVEDLATRYRAGKTPSFFVVKPGSTMGTRLKLFEYAPNSRPEPIEAASVLESLKAASTPAYQTLF